MTIAAEPEMPTLKKIDDHCVTHLPHRSRCEACIKAKRHEEAHASQKEKGAKPIIAMDYTEFGAEANVDDKIKTILVKDEESGCLAAHVVEQEQKGAADQWTVDRALHDIKIFRHADIILKSDGESALAQLQDDIISKRTAGSVPQKHPAFDPQAIGAVERGVQESMK